MSEKSLLRDELVWKDGTETFERNLADKIEAYSEIILFGAGIGGKMTHELLEKYGQDYKVRAFSDNNRDKIGKFYLGKPVIAPDRIKCDEGQLIVICSTAFDIISEQLLNIGIKAENIYYFQPAGVSLNRNEDILFVRENIHRYEAVYEQLADEKSRRIYRCLLNYKLTKSLAWLDEIRECVDEEDDQYFDAEILRGYSFSEGIVDAGAYVGDTIARFFKHFPEYQGNYYCLEAGNVVYERLCRNVGEMKYKKIYTYKYAVWDERGSLKFDTMTFGDGSGSRVSCEGELVDCDSLDHILDGKSVDFIKMDIEGSEKKALLGAEMLIKRFKPILTICIYHKPEDFFEIPETILGMTGDEYLFYVRQYRYGQSETVLYAMPKSRKIK